MASYAAAGKKALAESKFDEAIRFYTLALKHFPSSPDYLIQRSTAYQRAKQYPEAFTDANNAVRAAQDRGKREFIVEGQFRRGVACYQLGRYGDAKFLLELVKKMNGKHNLAAVWLTKTDKALETCDETQRVVTVKEKPDAEDCVPSSGDAAAPAGETTSIAAKDLSSTASSTPQPPASQQTPAEKIRHEWYQNSQNVYFTLLVKGVDKNKAQIDITPRSLSISFPLATGSSYDLTLDPLYAEVVADRCIKRVLPSKVEIILVKKVEGEKWKTLESAEPISTESKTDTPASDGLANSEAVKAAVLKPSPATATSPPAYPTSSKSGPKNWDKITSEASAALRDPSKSSTGDDDEEDFEGGDEANAFFKKLYKNASPEVQRAMMKSYVESNGTALSTNWDEVSKGPVETAPPEGMEAKPWEK